MSDHVDKGEYQRVRQHHQKLCSKGGLDMMLLSIPVPGHPGACGVVLSVPMTECYNLAEESPSPSPEVPRPASGHARGVK